MPFDLTYVRRGLLAVVIGTTLAACGAAVVPGTPPTSTNADGTASVPARPSVAASIAPSPSATASPSVAASMAASASAVPSTAAGMLPQPLLVARDGQIVRVERDGTTSTQLTHEQPGQSDIMAVTTFDVSPKDGALAYTVQGRDVNLLVRTDADGGQRTVLLEDAYISNVRWSPDGSRIAVSVNSPTEAPSPRANGVYIISADGGEPQLLQANDTTDMTKPDPAARGYFPRAWSPDGTRLLLAAYSLGGELCNAAVKDIASGGLVRIQAPEGLLSDCHGGQWSVDGQRIYIIMSRPGPQPPIPGLWTADPTTGAITPFIQGEFEVGYQMVAGFRPLPDGSINTFLANVDTVPEPYSGVYVPYKLVMMGPTDSVALRDEDFTVTGPILWAPDNSGVVAEVARPDGSVRPIWIPVNGDPVLEMDSFLGEGKQWARP